MIHLIHNLSPTILPGFLKVQVPAITTLHFRETECDSGLLKIYKQEDSWTLEGKNNSSKLLFQSDINPVKIKAYYSQFLLYHFGIIMCYESSWES